MYKKPLIGCSSILILLFLGAWFGIRYYLKPAPKVERTETTQRGSVEIKVVETGAIEPVSKVEVKSKVGGRISKLYVDEGMAVRQGQVLATIDPQEINSQVLALKAQLAGSEARLAAARQNARFQELQTTTSIDQYRHNVDAARAKLEDIKSQSAVQPRLTRQAINIARANLIAAQQALVAQQQSLKLLVESTNPQAVVSAQSAYEEALAQAESDSRSAARQKQLLASGFIAVQDVDVAETQARVSAARARDAKDHLDRVRGSNAIQEANARAQVASADGQVKQMEAALAQAQTSVLPFTMRRQVESATAAYQQAIAQLAAAQAGRSQDMVRRDEVASAAAEVLQLQNQVNELLVSQGDTTILAVMPGIITHRYVEPGELITSAIGSFSSGTAIFQLADVSTMLVRINVNEVDIDKVKTGMMTEVTVDGAPGAMYLGMVHQVAPASTAPAADSSGAAAQGVIRYPVEIVIAHPDARLKPGMSARCSIIVARRRNVVRAPVDCVKGAGTSATVQVVTTSLKNGKPVETTTTRKVAVGLRGDDYVEILSGLQPGEKLRPAPYTGPPRKTIEMRGGP